MTQEQRDRLTREKADAALRRQALIKVEVASHAARMTAVEHCDEQTQNDLAEADAALDRAQSRLADLERRIGAVLSNPTPLRDLLAQAAESLVYATEAWSGDPALDEACSDAGIPACLEETAQSLLNLTAAWGETMCDHGFEITGRDGDECPACAVEMGS